MDIKKSPGVNQDYYFLLFELSRAYFFLAAFLAAFLGAAFLAAVFAGAFFFVAIIIISVKIAKP